MISLVGLDIKNQYDFSGFVVIRFNLDGETVFKVFGSSAGSYFHGDSWRLNSGISMVRYNKEHFAFVGHSGSAYIVPRCGGRITSYNRSVLAGMVDEARDYNAEIIDNDNIIDVLTECGILVEEVG